MTMDDKRSTAVTELEWSAARFDVLGLYCSPREGASHG